MVRLLTLSFIVFFILTTKAQTLTTFPVNGPDDFREPVHAFVNATVWVSYQTKIDSAILVIKGGKVLAIGKSVSVPAGAIIHDVSGKVIYPGFIDLFSDYGMPEVAKPKWDDKPQMETNIKGAFGNNQAIHTDFYSSQSFVKSPNTADELRKLGFTTVLTHRNDGIAQGTGSLVNLDVSVKENLVIVKPDVSAHYSFSKGSSTQDYPSSLMGAIALLRQTAYDALWYDKTDASREYNINLEEWSKQQKLVQIFDASADWQTLLRADKVGDEFGKQYIIKSKGDEYKRIEDVKATGARLIVPLNFPAAYDVEDPYKALWVSLADMKHWELAPSNAFLLSKAGIEFCFTTADLTKKEDFLSVLRKAVKRGLDSTVALKALTYNPAQFVNALDITGTLDAGKQANFIITTAGIFSDNCVINESWVQGNQLVINEMSGYDPRGDYDLKLISSAKQYNYKLVVSGDVSSPKSKALLADSIFAEVKLKTDGSNVSLLISTDKKQEQPKIRLSGIVSAANNSWNGRGQLGDGTWVSWTASRTKAFVSEPAKADTAKPEVPTIAEITYPFIAYGNTTTPEQENYLLQNATVWTNEREGVLENADVIIKNGKISAVGKKLSCTDCMVIDATGKHVTSGIIDEHSHIAIAGGVNEGTESSSAEVRIGDVVNCEDINIYRQLAGGVTTCQLLHGSANPIGGQSALIKLRWGYSPEKMKIEGADGFIKFALGENVKQSNWGDYSTVRYPQTRMGVEQTYYNYFTKAKEYQVKWDDWKKKQNTKSKIPSIAPRRDLELEALAEILNKKRFITCHSYVQSEINMLMHVADTFGFRVNTFTHILEGYKVADKMKTHGANASTFADWWAYKYEVIDAIPYNTAILTKMGINTAVNSDDAEMARRLNQEAAKSVKYGELTEEQAWKTVTLNPAKMLHLDSRMGSLKAGKDADVVIWSDNPLSIYARVEQTFVDGILFYDAAKDAQMREVINRIRAMLIQKMMDEKRKGGGTQAPQPQSNFLYSCGHEH